MARNSIPEFSTTPGDNTDVGGVNIAELFPAANINNAIRQNMAFMKAYLANVDTLASATSIDLGAAVGNFVTITGTTTITALGTVAAGTWKDVTFSGSLTMTYNATTLILPGAVDMLTTVGDTARFISLGSGNWMCVQYNRVPSVFSAGKNGVDQTGIVSGVSTKVTFTHELLDIGGYYDATNSLWKPPAGIYLIVAQAQFSAGLVDQASIFMQIRSNGSVIAQNNTAASGGNVITANVTTISLSDGTISYDVFVSSNLGGTKTVSGAENFTFFKGCRVG